MSQNLQPQSPQKGLYISLTFLTHLLQYYPLCLSMHILDSSLILVCILYAVNVCFKHILDPPILQILNEFLDLVKDLSGFRIRNILFGGFLAWYDFPQKAIKYKNGKMANLSLTFLVI